MNEEIKKLVWAACAIVIGDDGSRGDEILSVIDLLKKEPQMLADFYAAEE